MAEQNQTMSELLGADSSKIHVLSDGEVIKGNILSVGKNEVFVDVDGIGVGVVRGRELYDDEQILSSLKIGDEVYASVVEIENKDGNIELSFRKAGQERVWQTLREKLESREVVRTKILEANKGGLMVKINAVVGFLPVSQLAPAHYPRVEDGDKNKILSVLRGFVGQEFDLKIITAEQDGEKLIVSERAVIEGELMQKISKLTIGQVVSGEITGVVDFGAFIKFENDLEGLVHISELAWQRIENPKDIVKVGDKVKAQIIAIDNDRISLSLKRLQKDPWEDAVKKYTVGQVVKGKVLKLAPFGAFVELDADIHGLAHLGELSDTPVTDVGSVLKEGEEREFKIISIEPAEHRLGLSIKALKQQAQSQRPAPSETAVAESPAPAVPEAAPAEPTASPVPEAKPQEEIKPEA
ncbi:S1 RNA-binding domain-containing protein [bacterium]|nr:MAG: S1 RNA-binding domain-containing protein [bacterium]